jgi:hypothetical protein
VITETNYNESSYVIVLLWLLGWGRVLLGLLRSMVRLGVGCRCWFRGGTAASGMRTPVVILRVTSVM